MNPVVGLRFVVVDGCDLLWVGGCWSTRLLWVTGVGCGDWFVGLLRFCCDLDPVDGFLLLVGCNFLLLMVVICYGLEVVATPIVVGRQRGCRSFPA